MTGEPVSLAGLIAVGTPYTQTYDTAVRTITAPTTDSGGGTTVAAVAATVGVYNLVLPAPPNLSTLSTGGVDVATGIVLGHRFKIRQIEFITTLAGTGASASLVFNLEIGTTNLTGGVLTLALADTDTIGKRTAATAVTANNVGTSTDAISLEVAAGGTAFTAGSGYFVIEVQNMDTADAFTALVEDITLAFGAINAVIDDLQEAEAEA